jgi:hypothetical protein
MVWSQLAEIQTPAVLTTDFPYLRFIGDRIVREDDFGRIETDIWIRSYLTNRYGYILAKLIN